MIVAMPAFPPAGATDRTDSRSSWCPERDSHENGYRVVWRSCDGYVGNAVTGRRAVVSEAVRHALHPRPRPYTPALNIPTKKPIGQLVR